MKSRQSTCWSELLQISERDGKLGLHSTGLEGRAVVPAVAAVRSQQPESPLCSAIELKLCASARELALEHSLAVEISLNLLLTRDELANRFKSNADFAYCFAYCSIFFSIFSIFIDIFSIFCI